MRKSFLTLITGISCITLSAQYCIPAYTAGTTDNDYIDGFEINTLNNLGSGAGDGSGYSDFTDLSSNLNLGETYSLHIVNTPSFTEGYRCWIDYNHDENFTDDEQIIDATLLSANEEITLDFTVPVSATPGLTRLRLRCVYNTTAFTACNTQTYGEAEDYSILIGGLAHDLSVIGVSPIEAGCDLSATATITINIENFGTEIASGFNMNLRVDGGTIITEPYPSAIAPAATANYTFSGTADLSADGIHEIMAWTTWAEDEFAPNDSALGFAENTSTYLTAGFPENICYAGGTIFPSPIAGGGIWTGDAIIDNATGEMNPELVGGIGSSTTVTYSFTPDAAYTVTPIPYTPFLMYDPTTVGLGDDAFIDNINIGFDFNFFGNTYNELFIGSNGYIGFSAGSSSYTVQHFPAAAYPNNIIAFCFTDLNPNDGGDIYYETQGTAPYRRFIVYYDEVSHYGSGATVSGQIVIYETANMIDIISIDIESDGGNMTQGIENIIGTEAYFADESYNMAAFSLNNTAWRYAVTPCSGTVTDTISFITPPDISIADATVCSGTAVTLDAGPGAENYVWNTGETTQSITVNESGFYWVTYFANLTCSVSDSATIIVNPLPVINLGSDGITCEGTMLDAENIGANYLWNTGNTTQTLFVTETGTYSVEVINPITGCSNADTITIEITPLPVANYDALITGALTVVFTSTATDANTWFWDFGDGSTSTIENPWHTYATAGSYTVTFVVTNDCGADITSTVVDATTGLNNLDLSAINIYPNPTENYFTIQLPEYLTNLNGAITIFNLMGEEIITEQQITSATGQFNLADFASGNYRIVIRLNDNIYQYSIIKK